MPFKSQVIQYLDSAEKEVLNFNSCNTVKIHEGKLLGYNTDVSGIIWLSEKLSSGDSISVLGDGAMGQMLSMCLKEKGYSVTIFSRRLGNWASRHGASPIVINATAIGTAVAGSPLNDLDRCNLIVDLALKPSNLAEQAFNTGITYIPGLQFYKQVFLAQFLIYTGIHADGDYFDTLNG